MYKLQEQKHPSTGTEHTIREGEYTIPDDCRAIVAGDKVLVFGRRHGTLKRSNLRCMYCIHFRQGHTFAHQERLGYICDMKPKDIRKCSRNGPKLYYTATKYGKKCCHFESIHTAGGNTQDRLL